MQININKGRVIFLTNKSHFGIKQIYYSFINFCYWKAWLNTNNTMSGTELGTGELRDKPEGPQQASSGESGAGGQTWCFWQCSAAVPGRAQDGEGIFCKGQGHREGRLYRGSDLQKIIRVFILLKWAFSSHLPFSLKFFIRVL